MKAERVFHMIGGDGDAGYAANSKMQGRVEKEKMESFNLALYAPSVDEVEAAIERSGLFDVDHVELFATNWDLEDDDTDSDVVLDGVQSGVNLARGQRAVIGALLMHHFGEDILDDLFEMYARNVAEHLEAREGEDRTKYAVILLSLKARGAMRTKEAPTLDMPLTVF